jgi:hypothetical protein
MELGYNDYEIDIIANKIAGEFEEAIKDKKFKNPETGNQVKFQSLPVEQQTKIREQFSKITKQDKNRFSKDPKFRAMVVDRAIKEVKGEKFKGDLNKGVKQKDIEDLSNALESGDKKKVQSTTKKIGLGLLAVAGYLLTATFLDQPGVKLALVDAFDDAIEDLTDGEAEVTPDAHDEMMKMLDKELKGQEVKDEEAIDVINVSNRQDQMDITREENRAKQQAKGFWDNFMNTGRDQEDTKEHLEKRQEEAKEYREKANNAKLEYEKAEEVAKGAREKFEKEYGGNKIQNYFTDADEKEEEKVKKLEEIAEKTKSRFEKLESVADKADARVEKAREAWLDARNIPSEKEVKGLEDNLKKIHDIVQDRGESSSEEDKKIKEDKKEEPEIVLDDKNKKLLIQQLRNQGYKNPEAMVEHPLFLKALAKHSVKE